jgi:uridine kinase
MKTFLIGIAGGSGSGKTYLANKILDTFKDKVLVIQQDSYYKDLSGIEFNKRNLENFDHPNSIDIKLLKTHITKLLNGKSIDRPTYSFSEHIRKDQIKTISPKPIIIVEGILILSFKELLNLFSLKIFINIKSDIRFIRRLKRDIKQRNRSALDVCRQYLSSVRPMHDKFVKPSKNNSDFIVKSDKDHKNIINIIKHEFVKSL